MKWPPFLLSDWPNEVGRHPQQPKGPFTPSPWDFLPRVSTCCSLFHVSLTLRFGRLWQVVVEDICVLRNNGACVAMPISCLTTLLNCQTCPQPSDSQSGHSAWCQKRTSAECKKWVKDLKWMPSYRSTGLKVSEVNAKWMESYSHWLKKSFNRQLRTQHMGSKQCMQALLMQDSWPAAGAKNACSNLQLLGSCFSIPKSRGLLRKQTIWRPLEPRKLKETRFKPATSKVDSLLDFYVRGQR